MGAKMRSLREGTRRRSAKEDLSFRSWSRRCRSMSAQSTTSNPTRQRRRPALIAGFRAGSTIIGVRSDASFGACPRSGDRSVLLLRDVLGVGDDIERVGDGFVGVHGFAFGA